MKNSFDLVVIGGGSAGFGAIVKASELGASVALIENGETGGTGVNVGSVPSKRMLAVGDANYYGNHLCRGVTLSANQPNMAKIVGEKDQLVQDLRTRKYLRILEDLPGLELVKGTAQFVSRTTLKVNDKEIHGRNFVIASGSFPRIPGYKGTRIVDYLTNAEALNQHTRPNTLLIIGGRALALEFAQMYAHFGTRVTLLQRSKKIIPNEEPEISDSLLRYLQEEEIEINTDVRIKEIRNRGQLKAVSAIHRGRVREYVGDELLMATGRSPNIRELGLQRIGVKTRVDGSVVVNEEMQTSVPNIWAAGDVVGGQMLETVAAKGGSIAAHNAIIKPKRKMDVRSVPHAIFTTPQVASVGLTDVQAHKAGVRHSCRLLHMSDVPKAQIIGDTRGLVKLVIEDKTRRIIGVHILASLAAEMIHEGVMAVKFNLTIDDLVDMVHVFPTMSEAIQLTAQSFYRDVNDIMTPAEDTSNCLPPDAAKMNVNPNKGDLDCILCGKVMYYDKNMVVYVCLNKSHGVLAYYAVDDCYFTSREQIGVQFLKEGRKFHMLQPEVMAMMGVAP